MASLFIGPWIPVGFLDTRGQMECATLHHPKHFGPEYIHSVTQQKNSRAIAEKVVSRENRSLWQLLSLAKTAEVSRPPAADAGMRKNKENAHSSQEFKLRGRADPSSPFASSIWTKEKHTYDDAYTVMATETKFSFHQERHFVRDPKDCIPRSAPPRSISTRLARCSFPRLRAVHGA